MALVGHIQSGVSSDAWWSLCPVIPDARETRTYWRDFSDSLEGHEGTRLYVKQREAERGGTLSFHVSVTSGSYIHNTLVSLEPKLRVLRCKASMGQELPGKSPMTSVNSFQGLQGAILKWNLQYRGSVSHVNSFLYQCRGSNHADYFQLFLPLSLVHYLSYPEKREVTDDSVLILQLWIPGGDQGHST